jgi:hypothetical protein
VVVCLDYNPAFASGPLAWSRPGPFRAFSDVFGFATGSLTRTDVDSLLVPNWAASRKGSDEEELDSVVEFLFHAPGLEFHQRVPLVSRAPSLPVARDASVSLRSRWVNGFHRRRGNYRRTVSK